MDLLSQTKSEVEKIREDRGRNSPGETIRISSTRILALTKESPDLGPNCPREDVRRFKDYWVGEGITRCSRSPLFTEE